MHFNPHTILPIVALMLALVCGIFVLWHNPKAKLNRIFFFICLDIAIWQSFYIPFNLTVSEQLLVTWFKITYCFISFLPIMCFTFVSTYLNTSRNIFWYRVNSLIGFTFCILSITTSFIVEGINYLPWHPYPKAGIFAFLLISHCGYLAFFCLKLLFEGMKNHSVSPKSINHLKYMFIAISTLALGMWDFLAIYGFKIYPVGPITCTIFLIIVTTAIVKHQLMDINVAIRKGIVYSIVVTIITLFYFLSIYVTEHIFQEMLGYRSLFISLGWAAIITLAFTPLKNTIQSFVEKNLFKNNMAGIIEENDLLRQELIQTEKFKAVATLASGMAHEIKNPLTAIKTFSEYLPQKIKDEAFLKKFAPIILNEAQRIDDLVHELLTFARPTPVELKPVNAHALLDNTLDCLSNAFLKHRIALKKAYRLDSDLVLNLDTNQFKQALLNIFLNAIEVMPNGGELSVSTEVSNSPGHVLIKICDTGPGIAPEDLPHIFDPFFSKKDHGTGLGLSITYEIIKNHNGSILVESKINQGTTFIIELPTL